ncbi:MAG: carbohydrate binding family 9 domain-containing protein, partial [Candidatus Aminicenantes bacterium]|nr:carbohydrate binding family 9 domain-containing protein [Candidatus Aminicenantes bacterium]
MPTAHLRRSFCSLAAAALAALLFAPAPAGAASLNPDEKPLVIPKAAQPPVLDGSLDEPAWAQALKVDGFKTFKPDFGKEASQKTEAFVTYDAENLYFAFRCYDSEPDKVKAAMSKRDNIFQDDIVFINVDTFNDNQSAFVFMLNPLGIQGDGMLTVAGNVEVSFDTIWYSKGRIDDQGWAVEARIPLQSLRFPNRDVLTWRILFIRFFTRTSEQVSLPALDPAQGSLLSQAMPLQLSGLT